MKFFYYILAAALPAATVDQLVSVLTSFAAKLAAAEHKQLMLAEGLQLDSEILASKAAAARLEASRAARIADRISRLAD